MEDTAERSTTTKRKTPMETANIFSLIFFRWMNETLKVGSQRPLCDDDLFPLQNEFKTETLVNKLEIEWLKEISTCGRESKRPRLWRVVFRIFSRRNYVIMAVIKFTHSVSTILLPLMVWYFLMSLSEGDDVKYRDVIPYVFGICIMAVIKGISHHHSFFWGGIHAAQAKAAVIGLTYKKILTLNRRALSKIISGNTINLVSNDANHLMNAGWSLLFLSFAPLEIVSSGVLVWYLLGWQALVGTGFFLVVIAYISILSNLAGRFRERAAAVTDKRLEKMDEIIAGIRTVKINAWEWNFRDSIRKWRSKEIGFIRRRGAIISSFDALYFTNTPIAGFISVSTLILTNNYLTSFQIFTLLSTLNVIKFSVSVSMGETLHLLADTKVALERIQAFLEEGSAVKFLERYRKLSDRTVDGMNDHFHSKIFSTLETKDKLKQYDVSISKPFITLINVSCSWSVSDHDEQDKQKTLQNITMEVSNKQLLVITGPVGCGKSSLLQAILGELPHHSGHIARAGSIAYVPQVSWVFSGTIQSNIIFGNEFDKVKYQRIMEACNLQKDINQFPRKDLTHIGQRGASLSGGQQARVCLARALYTNADIFLLDDPLSAVDAHVGNHLFQECIMGLLADKVCILVTHQQQFLEKADIILVIQQGTVVRQGKYHELKDEEVLSRSIVVENVAKIKDSRGVSRVTLRRKSTRLSSIRSRESFVQDLVERAEDRVFGSVAWSVYWQYFRAALPGSLIFLLAFLVVFVQVFMISPYWWLSKIAEMTAQEQKEPVTLLVYGSLVFGALLLSTVVSFLFFNSVLRASQKLHDKMVTAVIKAPVFFFDTNPTGRILNRFSKDTGCMDDTLPPQFLLAVQLSLFSLGAMLLSAFTNYWLFIGIIPLILLFLFIGRYYLKTSRELKRLEAIKCSPVYSHITDTVTGLEVIRSSGMEDRFLQDLFRHQDQNTPATIMVLGCTKWLGVRLEMLCSLLVTMVAVGAVVVTQNPALAGMALTYALETLDAAQYGVQLLSETENLMTSVERVMTYTQIKPEPRYATEQLPAHSWPSTGSLCIQDLTLRYGSRLHRVLKDITLHIEDKEKVGVVGRTGAGKSSILAALVRMPEPDGKVLVDGVDIGNLNVRAARKAFSVISQEPILFGGNLRTNLDPLSKHTDQELWATLEEMQIKPWIERLPGQLQYKLIEFGSNLSVGERQLICLARALLQKNKILILDEATANVDFKTDRLIQELIRNKFKDSTVVTIAHRLCTIIDYDRVMVLDRGRVVEFDKPNVLLKTNESYLAELVKSYNSTFG